MYQIVENNYEKITSYTCFTNAIDSFLACHKYPDIFVIFTPLSLNLLLFPWFNATLLKVTPLSIYSRYSESTY